MKVRVRLCAALAGIGALFAGPATAVETPEARVIVKLKASSPLKQIQAASRVQSLGQRIGITALMIGQPSPELQVMRASGITSEALAAKLAQQSDVEYAVPDRIKTIRALPNDPLFNHQWYLQAPNATQPAATDALGAWNLTGGKSGVVVAVVDTGVRFEHEDLRAKLLPGYDFVLDDLNSGDGQAGRDADASDPGDYLSTADLGNLTLRAMCGNTSTTHNSSWHGTQVAGIVAAEANNSVGIAGIAGATRILPIRVLGKCGGYDSDIIAGMRWAAGLAVPGLPANPNPARIINLSLAGSGTCSDVYRNAVAEIRAAGTLIVAAAGNETSPVEEPANCPGVLGVAGIRHTGTKVGYSSYGPEVGISAPAGNCVNTGAGEPCLYPFITPINFGLNGPLGNGYTGVYDVTIGTSFAVPLVSGTAALMLAANPALSEPELTARLKGGATAFPVDPSLPICPSVTSDGQCNCTTATCGAGMLNTAAAVALAFNATASIAVSSSQVVAETAVTLTAGDSPALTRWQWTQLSGPGTGRFGSPNAASTTFTATSAGDYTIRLTVTDGSGNTASADTVITVTAKAVTPEPGRDSADTAPAKSSGGGGGATDFASLAGILALALFAAGRRRA